MKKYWKDTWQYLRILEILEDYWLTEPDEQFVCVDLYFEKANGEHQHKTIKWYHPSFKAKNFKAKDFEAITLRELVEKEFLGLDRGGILELVRDDEGIPIGVKNRRTGIVEYFKTPMQYFYGEDV